jgi:hypothetical protein
MSGNNTSPLSMTATVIDRHRPKGWESVIDDEHAGILTGFYEFVLEDGPGLYMALRVDFTAAGASIVLSSEALLYTNLHADHLGTLDADGPARTLHARYGNALTRARCIAHSYADSRRDTWPSQGGGEAA